MDTTFTKLETLLLDRKVFLLSKGLKNVLCLKVDTKHCAGAIAMFCIEPERRQSTFLGPLE